MAKKGITKYITKAEFKKIKEFSKGKQTPFLVINLNRVQDRYDDLKENMPYAKIYYAVKSNPLDEIIMTLEEKGSNFDVATVFEIDRLLRLRISPDRMSYGNTIKKASEIKYAYDKGIRLFATDSISDINKLAKYAPGSKVLFRLMLEGNGAIWPLSKKFGAHPDMIYHLILEAKKLGLEPYGISFHVGSQQKDVGQWDHAISLCKYLFDLMKKDGIFLKCIDLGGGLPTNYVDKTPDIEVYAETITKLLKEDFQDNFPDIIIEPGRYMVGDCGTIVTEIILISVKSEVNESKWVYLDVGRFNGLAEAEDVIYPIFPVKSSKDSEEVILAGPTCESCDIIYQNYKHKLPRKIKEGDKLYILSTGAYTWQYSNICVNGFPVLKTYILE